MNILEEINSKTKDKTFEEIKHIDNYGNEYWEARELQRALNYSKWENFEKVISNAKEACQKSKIDVSEHFPEVRKLSKRANNAVVKIKSLSYVLNVIIMTTY